MRFGTRIRELREEKAIPQKELSDALGISTSYVNKVERGKLHAGEYPSAKFLHKLAQELDADEDELLLMADKVPDTLRQRIRERPEVFSAVAELNNKAMDQLLKQIVPSRR